MTITPEEKAALSLALENIRRSVAQIQKIAEASGARLTLNETYKLGKILAGWKVEQPDESEVISAPKCPQVTTCGRCNTDCTHWSPTRRIWLCDCGAAKVFAKPPGKE
jgi:hypothetical protein